VKLSYPALLALSDDYTSRSVYLSGFSFALLISWVAQASNRWQWQTSTDTEWDTIDALVSKCIEELQLSADVGVVVPLMTAVIPERYLLCDGGTYNREDYPLLYSILPASLIIDADQFTVPDMAGLAAVGATISRPLLTQFGEETHTLTEAELAPHAHTYTPAVADLDLEDVGVPTPAASVGILPAFTGTTGGGLPHNNIQPSISLYWCVVAR